MFFPINSKVRKKLGKESGDSVRITLYEDKISEQIREELRLCLENEPQEIADRFQGFSSFLQYNYLGWLQDARSDEEKAERIVKLIDELRNSY